MQRRGCSPGHAALFGVVLLALATVPNLAAQDIPVDTIPAPAVDTVPRAAPAPPEPEAVVSPRGAFLRSLVIPGWGQAVTGAPNRGAVYFAMEVGSVWMVYNSRLRLRDARVMDQARRDAGDLDPEQVSDLVRSRENQVEDWTTFAVFMLFFSAADALVSAYLADFDEQLGVTPGTDGRLQLQMSLPVGRRP